MGRSSGQPCVVAVVMGGPSDEREVSLSSGRECAAALSAAGFGVVEIDAGPDLPERLGACAPDVVFNALHGRWGEDGCVQGVLEWMGIPYTHSGVLSSALAMDKQKSKEAYRAAGLPTPDYMMVARDRVRREHVMEPPYVVKPNIGGSSIGVSIVMESSQGPPPLSDDLPETVMVEAYVPGRELAVSVLGDRALTVTDIISKDGWYDYEAKYAEGGSRHEVPAEIPPDVFEACLDYALRAHEVLGCRGLSRTDLRWDEPAGVAGLSLLETNTQPGMTPTSLSPEQARTVGMPFPELCGWLVEDASCNR